MRSLLSVPTLLLSSALFLSNCSDPVSTHDAMISDDAAVSATDDTALFKNRTTATVMVGRPGVGTDFFPPGSHDASFHAIDSMTPGAVVIGAGGTVRFEINFFHTLAVYGPGTRPGDVDTSLLRDSGIPGFPPIIDDPSGRVVNYPLSLPGPGGVPVVEHTFEEPGRYLFICEVLPHFAVGRMYGWVIVQ